MRWTKREDVDELQFRDEIQHYLAELRSCGNEAEALRRTKANYPRLRDSDVQSWPQDEAYRLAHQEARALGAEALAFEQRQAEARRGYDPFSAIPARDDPQPGPEGALDRFVRHGLEVLHGTRESQLSNFVPLEDVTPAMQAELWAQSRATQPAQQAASPFRRAPSKEEIARQREMGSYSPSDVERGWDGT